MEFLSSFRLPEKGVLAHALGVCTIIACALLFCLPHSSFAQEPLTATSAQLRALYVQRIVKYVTWPEDSTPTTDTPIIVAATAPRTLTPYFKDPAFKVVQWPTPNCHVLLITGEEVRTIAAILQRTEGRPILTIGQNSANPRLGMMINFVETEGKLRLQINPRAAEAAGLTISSRLLKLAQVYEEERHE